MTLILNICHASPDLKFWKQTGLYGYWGTQHLDLNHQRCGLPALKNSDWPTEDQVWSNKALSIASIILI